MYFNPNHDDEIQITETLLSSGVFREQGGFSVWVRIKTVLVHRSNLLCRLIKKTNPKATTGYNRNHFSHIWLLCSAVSELFSCFLLSWLPVMKQLPFCFFLSYVVLVLHFRECKTAEPVFMLVSVASFETAFLQCSTELVH